MADFGSCDRICWPHFGIEKRRVEAEAEEVDEEDEEEEVEA